MQNFRSDPNVQLGFAVWCRRCRESLGLSRSVFGALAGLTEPVVKSIETNRKVATAEDRQQIVAALLQLNPALAATMPPETAP